jgi:hypothetical protein
VSLGSSQTNSVGDTFFVRVNISIGHTMYNIFDLP